MVREDEPGAKAARSTEWKGRSRLLYELVRLLITSIVRVGLLRIDVEGVENVPTSGPALILSNHQSNLDPPLIGWTLTRPISIPGKVELFRVPVLGWLLRQLGSFPVDRSGRDAASLRRSLNVLRSGHLLLMFPEGTRSRTGAVGRFQPVIARLAQSRQAPVIPVALTGTGGILPPGAKWPRLGQRIQIRYGRPIALTTTGPDSRSGEEAAELVRSQVVDLLAGLEPTS